ncbi:uncharacterized protein TrAFT101_000238 [Trichoderma asperellum]|uniref:uncharacterized protein n=1 Tax=Trichoderma asperellum TaxID=101201 RepID=UPI00331A4068|nr:hypothetical protein TrAFT101_000238 [Trichoderma asperellum]
MASPSPILSRERILHALRTLIEYDHRVQMVRRSTDFRWLYQPNIADLGLLAAEMTHKQANDCFNKATPIYIFSARRSFYTSLLLKLLHNFLYTKWYRPYRNEVEYRRFLAKTFLPQLLPSDLQPGPLVDFATKVHDTICKRAQAAQDAVKRLDPDNLEEPLDSNLPANWWDCEGLDKPGIIQSQKGFILQPLFQAVIISIRLEAFNKDTELSQIPVLLIRTGVEEGLSAPVSFDPIAHKIKGFIHSSGGKTAAQMTLETAVEFVISLENREIAAFGYQPSPAVSTQKLHDASSIGDLDIMYEARRMGWGDEVLAGPSSQWVADPEESITWESECPWVDRHYFPCSSYMLARAIEFDNRYPEGPRGMPWRGGKHF